MQGFAEAQSRLRGGSGEAQARLGQVLGEARVRLGQGFDWNLSGAIWSLLRAKPVLFESLECLRTREYLEPCFVSRLHTRWPRQDGFMSFEKWVRDD